MISLRAVLPSLFCVLLSFTSADAQLSKGAWELFGPIKFNDVALQSPSTVVATTDHGYIYTSTNWGASWQHRCIDDTLHLGRLAFCDSLHGALIGSQYDKASFYRTNTIFITSDGGVTWERSYLPNDLDSVLDRGVDANITSIAVPSVDTMYLCDNYGFVFRTTDHGRHWTWKQVYAGPFPPSSLNRIYFLDSKTGFTIGNSGFFAKTSDAGEHWTRQDIGGGDSTDLYSIDFFNRDVGAVFGFGYSYVTTNGGISWLYKPTPIIGHNVLYTGRWMNDHQFFAFGPSGQFYLLNGFDQDMTVTLLDSAIYSAFSASVWSAQHGAMVLGFSGGLVLRSANGVDWTAEQQFGLGMGPAVAFDNTIYCVPGGNFTRSTDGGQSWRITPFAKYYNGSGSFGLLHFTDSLHGLAFNSNIITASRITSDGGISWTDAPINDLSERVAPGSMSFGQFYKRSVFLSAYSQAYDTSYLYQSSDDGFTWTRDSVPLPDLVTCPYPDARPYRQGISNPFQYEPHSAYMICGVTDTIIGRGVRYRHYHSLLYLTQNDGRSWSRVNNPLTPNISSIFFLDKDRGFLGCDSNAVYRSVDGGESWTETILPLSPGPHYISAISFRDSLHGYLAANDWPAVFATSDGGLTWTNDSLNAPDHNSGGIAEFLFPDSNTVLALSNSGFYRRTIHSASNSSVRKVQLSAGLRVDCGPNPLSLSTSISLTSETREHCEISIANLLGVEVARLFSGELEAGEHTFTWSPRNLPDGLYECVVHSGDQVEVAPLMLLH